MQRFNDGRDWFFEKRFGLFVHWGLYAIPAWHEQHQWRGRVGRDDYGKLAGEWNPTRFDPDQWLDLMQAAGMEYLCVTTKHHDGFCLWDTKQTTFHTMNTPFGKDIIGMLADACHRRGVPLCLYYSCVDWHHPHYPNQGRHHELPGPLPGDAPDMDKYLVFVTEQVRELCTNYGEIHGFWWDMNVPKHVDRGINDLIRTLQPHAVINNRGYDDGDFGTPERDYDLQADAAPQFARPTEACQSVGVESWGYRRDEDYYADRHLLRSVAKYRALGANYLLNVGPKGDGTIPPEAEGIVRRVGEWYGRVREAFDGTTPANEWTTNRNVLLTRRDNTLFVFLYRDPATAAVKIKPLTLPPVRATLLNTGEPIAWTLDLAPSDHADQTGYLRLRALPVNEMANTVLVVKLEFAQLSDVAGSVTEKSDLLQR